MSFPEVAHTEVPDAPGLVAAVAGTVWFLRTRRDEAKFVGPALAGYFVAASILFAHSPPFVRAVNVRFGFFLYPFLALFAAGMIARTMTLNRRWGAVAACTLVGNATESPHRSGRPKR